MVRYVVYLDQSYICFNRSQRCHVTAIGKSLAVVCTRVSLVTKQYNLLSAKGDALQVCRRRTDHALSQILWYAVLKIDDFSPICSHVSRKKYKIGT